MRWVEVSTAVDRAIVAKAQPIKDKKIRNQPMEEGVIFEPKEAQKKKRPNGFFSNMGNNELVEYAKGFIEKREISGRRELGEADRLLYDELRGRELLDEVGLVEKQRSWKDMSDDELVIFANGYIKKEGITGKTELEDKDPGLYSVLRRRRLLSKIRFKRKQRSWKKMSDKRLVAFTERFMKKKGITTKAELRDRDIGLHAVLGRRKLLDKINFESKRKPQKITKIKEPVETCKVEKRTSTEIENIMMERKKLIPKGMDDKEIAQVIAKQLGRRPETIGFMIWKAVKYGDYEENPNNHKAAA